MGGTGERERRVMEKHRDGVDDREKGRDTEKRGRIEIR